MLLQKELSPPFFVILPLFSAAFAHESKLYLPLNLLCRQNHGARLDFLCTFSTNVFLQKCESVNFIYCLSSDLIFLFAQNRSSIFVQHKQKQARIFYTRKKIFFVPFFRHYQKIGFSSIFIPFIGLLLCLFHFHHYMFSPIIRR